MVPPPQEGRGETIRHESGTPAHADAGADTVIALLQQLAETIGTRYALLGRIDPDGVVHASTVSAGGAVTTGIAYALAGTPCEQVASGGVCVYPRDASGLFPGDALLVSMGIESYAGIALRDVDGRFVGLLAALGTEPLHRRARVEPTLRLFAARVRAEIGRIDAESALRASERRLRSRDAILAAVADASERLVRAQRWSDVVPEMLELVGRAAAAGRAYLLEVVETAAGTRSRLAFEWVEAGVTPPAPDPPLHDVPVPEETVARLRRGEVVHETRATAPAPVRKACGREGTMSALLVPVIVDGTLEAIVGFDDCEQERRWQPSEVEALRLAAGALAAAAERERAIEGLQTRERILEALAAAAERLFRAASWELAIDDVLALLGRATGASRAYIFQMRAVDGGVASTLTHEWVADGVEPSLRTGIWTDFPEPPEVLRLLERGEPHLLRRDDASGAVRRALEQEGTLAAISFPIISERGLLGEIGFDDCVRERDWISSQRDALRAAAGIIGAAIERSRVEAALRESEGRLLQAQKMEAIGRLAASVAHDFNNVLTAVDGYASLLREELTGEQRRFADDILEASSSAHDLVSRLLSLGRPCPLEVVDLDLQLLVREVQPLVAGIVRPHVDLSLELAPAAVRADRTQVQQLLLNLVTNAVDAMPAGGTLRLETGCDRARSRAWLVVADTGLGMDAATRERCYEPFFTTKGEGRGTGLGLATVYGIVMGLDGTIELESEPGAGTRFTIELPAA